jgi:hypothetical protein
MVLCICGNRLKRYGGVGFKKMRRGIFLVCGRVFVLFVINSLL